MRPFTFHVDVPDHSEIFSCSKEATLLTLEQKLKELYLKEPDLFDFRSGESVEKMRLRLRDVGKEFHQFYDTFPTFMGEDDFIIKENDVAVNRHLRYLPAIPHSHDFFEILYVLQGTAEHYTGNRHQYLKAGNLLIVSPKSIHALRVFNDDALIINLLLRTSTFEKKFMSILENRSILGNFLKNALYSHTDTSCLEFRAAPDPRLAQLAMELYTEECTNPLYSSQAKNQLISLFFTFLLRNHEKDIYISSLMDSTSQHDNNILFIIKYMESNYTHVSLRDLCDFFNYSERHLIRLIQKYTGMSFSENIRQLKLNHAASMLVETDYSFSRICEEIGYSNPNRFKTIFTEYYSCTPKEYRKKYKKV